MSTPVGVSVPDPVCSDAVNPHRVAILQTLAVLLATSLAGVLAKFVLRDESDSPGIPPFTLVWLQIAIGGTLLTAYTFGFRGERIPSGLGRRAWLYIACIGVGNFAVVRLMFMAALERLPATTNMYLVNYVGLVTMALSVPILKERPSWTQFVGAVLALAGLWVYFDELPPPEEITGVVFVAIGVLALAITNNIARKLGLIMGVGLKNNVLSTVALWIGGVPVVLAGLLFDTPPPVEGWSDWGIVALTGVVTIAVGLTVWNHVLRTLRSYEASTLAASSVIFVAVFAMPILGEWLGLRQWVGIVITVVGLVLAQLRRR